MAQQQFDWANETAKCIEGLKLDLEREYHFELLDTEVSLHEIGKDGEPPICYKKGPLAGQPIKMYTFPFRETQLNLEFKLDFFHSDSYRVNPTNPELEDSIVRFSRKLGYNPVVNGNFSIRDFVVPGIAFTAELEELAPKGTYFDKDGMLFSKDGKPVDRANYKIYKGIKIDTIKLDGGSASAGQQKINEPSKDVINKVKALAEGCKKFPELVKKISAEEKSDELLNAAMMMKSNGTLKF